MKRRISKILVLILLLGVVFGKGKVYAADSGVVSIDKASGKPGDSVELTVNLEKNPGIMAMYLSIGYDESVLKLESITDEGLLTDYMAGEITNNPVLVSWEMVTAAENDTSTGTLLTLKFTILDDAVEGDYEITLGSIEDGIFDTDFNNVPFEFLNGEVTVKEELHEHVYDGREEVVQEPSCTKDGIKRKYCSFEGCESYIEESISATGHTAGEWEIVKEATCTEDGKKEQKCTVCQNVLKEELIPATGHSYGEWMVTKEPAVGEDGLQVRTCTVCGHEDQQVIPAIEHGENDHVYDGKQEVVKEATCTETGIMRKYCSFDGCDAYVDEVIPATGHTAGEWEIVKEATCTEDGKKEQKCTVCQNVLKEELIPATGHSYGEWVVTKEPAVGEDGLQVRTCTVCGHEDQQVIPAIEHGEDDHVYDGKQEVVKEATCTETGIIRKYCSFDGCDAYVDEVIPITGHTAGEWEITEKATCTEDGKREQKCTVCQTVLAEEVVPAIGHSYGEWVITKEPAIGEEGVQTRTCTVCGHEDQQVIPALEHGEKDHVYDGKQEVVKEATCTEEGLLRKYCSFEGCDAYTDEVIPAIDHTDGEWKIIKEATCTENGEKEQTCTVCQNVIRREIISATGHAYGEWEILKEAEIGVEGEKQHTCTVCGHIEKVVIPALSDGKEEQKPIIEQTTESVQKKDGNTKATETGKVKTGDAENIIVWIMLAGIAVIMAGVAVKKKYIHK